MPSQPECDPLTERSRLQSPPGKEKEMKDHAISQDGPRRPALLVFDVNETPSSTAAHILVVIGVSRVSRLRVGAMLRV